MPGTSKKGGGLEVGSAYKMNGFPAHSTSAMKQKYTTNVTKDDGEMNTPYSPSWDPKTGEGELIGFDSAKNIDLSYLDDDTLKARTGYLMKFKPGSVHQQAAASDEIKLISRELVKRFKK
tara:strand:- start:401 stop:760 length:360 start_codon:yes stop_codon:yes gene_type:complete